MSDIQISMTHTLSTEDLLDRVMKLVAAINDTIPLEAKWKSNDFSVIQFEATGGMGKGTTGTLKLTREKVTIELKLPLILRPMAGSIRKDVEDDMRKAINE